MGSRRSDVVKAKCVVEDEDIDGIVLFKTFPGEGCVHYHHRVRSLRIHTYDGDFALSAR